MNYKSVIFQDELKEAVYAAIQEHGQAMGIGKNGVTTLNQWSAMARKDGHKVPDLNRWFKPNVQPYASSLLDLAEIFRSYGVEINGEIMPRDYFLSVFINGRYSAFSSVAGEGVGKVETRVDWVKKQLRGLPMSDRLAILGWFMGIVGFNIQSKVEELSEVSQ